MLSIVTVKLKCFIVCRFKIQPHVYDWNVKSIEGELLRLSNSAGVPNKLRSVVHFFFRISAHINLKHVMVPLTTDFDDPKELEKLIG